MTEGMEDLTAGSVCPPGSASPTGSAPDTGQVPEEKPEETETAGESGEEGAEGTAEGGGGGGGDGEHLGALGIVALPGTCCVCIEMEQINNCLHSERICILPILACLLSLALCTAGLKWVFVDKIFEYEPPTHLNPKPIGQDPIIISVDPTLGLTQSIQHSSPSTVSLTTAITITTGHPEVVVEKKSTQGPEVTRSDPSVTLKYTAKQTSQPQTTQLSNDIITPTISATSTTTTAKTSSHVTRCSDSQKNYCVNGGECFTLEIMPGSTKFLCRKQRKKLHDRLRQSLRNKRHNNTNSGTGSNSARGRQISNMPLRDLQLMNQCNGMSAQHAAEKETETTFSTSKYALSAHEPTTLTHISSQRFVSAVTSSNQLSPLCQTSPTTPGSPPSEMSAPLSSLAISVPSVALSPSGEEERPLLLSKKSISQKRTSAHYNHGHVAHSLPPSPLFTTENVNYQTIGDCDTKAVNHMVSASPEKQMNTSNCINDYINKRAGVANGHLLHNVESSGDSIVVMSKSEEPQGEHMPFLTTDSSTVLLHGDSRRTNAVSPNDDVQVKSSSSTTKQDLVAE
ncbi:pro-neuregulin-1, membrane-bound isoform isoform X3 [Anabas testudineus]|uniref:pro-neuregulin-1, membrane-bound isoform isoform X3 n=1 Tax=Anabas testudineus TaxID=64144 RepID=UPI000E453FB5|nr:pro-neuregulin-1, membrane-bound isoform isoform X3 [Anabas testudineus]